MNCYNFLGFFGIIVIKIVFSFVRKVRSMDMLRELFEQLITKMKSYKVSHNYTSEKQDRKHYNINGRMNTQCN